MINKTKLKSLKKAEAHIIKKLHKSSSQYRDNRESLIYFFSHEILHFFLTYITAQTFDKDTISKLPFNLNNEKIMFSKRKGKNVFLKQVYNFRKFINLCSSLIGFFCNFRYVLIGNTPFTRSKYFKLLSRNFLIPDYFISQSTIKVELPNINKQKKELYDLIENLIDKFNIPKKYTREIFKEVDYITNLYFFNIKTSPKRLNILKIVQKAFFQRCHSAIIGSPVNIINRHLAFICYEHSINVKVILHHGESGMTDQGAIAVDDWGAADDIIGYGSGGLDPFSWSKYISDWSKANYHSVENNNDQFQVRPIKSKFINVYDLLKKGKGLYIESRIHPEFSIISVANSYDPLQEINWREKLLRNYPRMDIKIHPKGINVLSKRNLNRCVTGPLEKVSQNYDYLLMDNGGSSAFSKVYFNNVPIILIDRSEGTIYSKKGLDFVKQRCELFFDRDLLLNPEKYKEKLLKSNIDSFITKNNFIINDALIKQWNHLCFQYSGRVVI